MWVCTSCKVIFLSESGLNSEIAENRSPSQLYVLNSYAAYIGRGENSNHVIISAESRTRKVSERWIFHPNTLFLCFDSLTLTFHVVLTFLVWFNSFYFYGKETFSPSAKV